MMKKWKKWKNQVSSVKKIKIRRKKLWQQCLGGKTGISSRIRRVSKGFDFKSIANDLGVEFGINPDSRVKSTLLGTVFEIRMAGTEV